MTPEGVSSHIRIGTEMIWSGADYYRISLALHHATLCTQANTDDWRYLQWLHDTAWELYKANGRVAA